MNLSITLNRKTLVVSLLVALLVAVVVFVAIARDRQFQSELADIEKYEVMTGDLEQLVFTNGVVTSRNTESLISPVNGTVSEILVSENEIVGVDTEILRIETTDALGNTTSQSIRSSIAGTVTVINLSTNDFVAAGQQVLAEIADLNSLEVTANIGENDINSLEVGQSAELDVVALDTTVPGEVSFVASAPTSSNQLGATTSSYRVRQTFSEIPENIKLGMTVEAGILVDSKSQVTIVEDIYIFDQDDGSEAVKKIVEADDGRLSVETVEVETGFVGEIAVEIVSGVEVGDQLILPTEEVANSRNNSIFGN